MLIGSHQRVISSHPHAKTYIPCHHCAFWVTPEDKQCPNCGTLKPQTQSLRQGERESRSIEGSSYRNESYHKTNGLMLGALLGFVVSVIVFVNPSHYLNVYRWYFHILYLILCFVPPFAGGWIGGKIGYLISKAKYEDRFLSTSQYIKWRHHPSSHLRQMEQTIQERLNELAARQKRALEIQRRIEQEGDKEQWQEAPATLEGAVTALQLQSDRYRAKLWEITLVRCQNRVEPLAAGWDNVTHEECASRLHSLQLAQKEGERLLVEWIHADLATTPDGQGCITRLCDALNNWEQLREALVTRQVVIAVKGIAPWDEARRATPATLVQLSSFDSRAELDVFSSAFSELETEYARLQSEERLAGQEELLQRIGGT